MSDHRKAAAAPTADGPRQDRARAADAAGSPAPEGGIVRAPRPRAEAPADRRRRRAAFLRELAEARELRARVQPRRTKAARMRQAVRMRTFRA
ncbi:hypothetical protein GXW83_00830 [Streptacidiphilus sp. PB12-B1b]|uniref:hypothetical protein n=1 Tax=Streptacidiphilus sp. PB12-B1b TaxID=2705012 RepID=UPI0015F8A59E|nr:hypothetical protein [Streptacidiphilus sp. PB12-B1b]QMU74390.1 hypothetical protein GXW83_00830 [Streptacidiphilus sp. PB12-B1b]